MSQILAMALKDLKLLARDRVGAFFIVGFPILMLKSGCWMCLPIGLPVAGSRVA